MKFIRTYARHLTANEQILYTFDNKRGLFHYYNTCTVTIDKNEGLNLVVTLINTDSNVNVRTRSFDGITGSCTFSLPDGEHEYKLTIDNVGNHSNAMIATIKVY